METLPANDFLDGCYSDEDDSQSDIWGRLYPLGSSFTALDMEKDLYTFGRGETCDVPFSSQQAKKNQCFQAYSKVHFKLHRQQTSTGFHVFLEDTSANGTFINGEKVGKNNKQVLSNNDEIALALKKNKGSMMEEVGVPGENHRTAMITCQLPNIITHTSHNSQPNHAFVYMDLGANEDKDLPKELTEKYTLSKELGRGACGAVRLGFAKGTCDKYAVKIINKKKFSVGGKHQVNMASQVMSEVKILKQLKHPCIIGIDDVIDTPDVLYIVLELVEGGELFDRIISVGQFSEAEAKLLFYQMVCACKYLHDQGITHRDLKPENILLSEDSSETLIKVTDFGLSKFIDAGSIMKTFCGTPTYLAPEVLITAGTGAYTKAIDCWSLGVILYICLVGYPPFSDERKDMDLTKQITGGHYSFPKQYWKDISDSAIDLVKKMMVVDPKQRISLADAVNHPWFKDDDMKAKARKIMYPKSDGMAPPMAMPTAKKRPHEGGDDSPKKRTSQDTASPPTTP